ncbi:hypothetical protein K450DRAFT_247016 [Umbelopsis ramanniana AG]|uniref:Zn(2)-C6 fungal-type domain-containing protein n=1 Tax=Umbelopsis ramanniana AG TaxID=1314678 RepID=A0AAD5HBT2_UMBRA|nr:uncharacterized protein K450DRAFT_247016 [Umbelopsis ramanniana AG]KAI8578475.1 hypothetical protein K450DRAFT_247016 [Umbelopsis ramanniana AG]
MTNSTTHPPPVHLTESPTTHSIQSNLGPESSSDSSSSDIKLEQNGSTSGLGSVRPSENNGNDSKKKRVGPKRKKVTHACVYCRRSHMTCDDGRPCQRCIKRSIGHLCHDEPKPSAVAAAARNAAGKDKENNRSTQNNGGQNNMNMMPKAILDAPFQMPSVPLAFASEEMGNEFSVISAFLDSLDPKTANLLQQHQQQPPQHQLATASGDAITNGSALTNNLTPGNDPTNTTEQYFITAADPHDGKLEDRLNEVINAKYEAGFLRPYNYVNGYARLQRYMDNHMSPNSRQRILNVMGTFRPAFRHVAQSLTDIDLILVEEAFERLLLDYDRVFSSMGIPACLWRRTGEIYKGNKEFAALVGVPIEQLREGHLCIYEMMAEDSAVNYWEKYGNIAFDAGQKAVLTSCLLKSPDPEKTSVISCCFSFTIRRDKYNM